MSSIAEQSEPVPDLDNLGMIGFTTTRQVGTFGVNGEEPVKDVMGRWAALRRELHRVAPRMATAGQVHGTSILRHDTDWRGWLRGDEADGHFAPRRGTAIAVTIADCIPIFIVHPGGASMILHSGWRGTAAGILQAGLRVLLEQGLEAREVRVHLGPAICGKCYEVSPEVYAQLTGRRPDRPTTVDLRAIVADRAREAGVRHLTVSAFCTRCDNARFFSHRAGDLGRQIGVLVAAGSS